MRFEKGLVQIYFRQYLQENRPTTDGKGAVFFSEYCLRTFIPYSKNVTFIFIHSIHYHFHTLHRMVLLLLTSRRLGVPNAASPGTSPAMQSKLTQSPIYLRNKGMEVGRSPEGCQSVICRQKDQGPSCLHHVHLVSLQQEPKFVLILSFYVITFENVHLKDHQNTIFFM